MTISAVPRPQIGSFRVYREWAIGDITAQALSISPKHWLGVLAGRSGPPAPPGPFLSHRKERHGTRQGTIRGSVLVLDNQANQA
jgi:hypothetical protein